ncbi:MAG: phage recombination protein Bet [Smithella sp.]
MSDKNETAVVKKNENSVEFVPFGGTDKLRLTASMVRQFVAVPTKSGALPSERDCIRFIMLCRGKRANPFEGDCFLIGYDSANGPSFSMVCGIELFLKRASAESSYDGNESGVIVETIDDAIIERPGTIIMHGEELVGGWAKVYRKDRKQVEYKSVKFDTYDTGRSRWVKDPGGQIAKVALSQALRSAYPTALGALYTQEEMQRITEAGDGVIEERAPVSMPNELPEPEKEKSDPDFELAEPEDAPLSVTVQPPEHPPIEEKKYGNPDQPADIPGDEELRITEPQSKRFYAIWHKSGRGDEEMRAYIFSMIGSPRTKDIPKRMYEKMCAYAEKAE